MTKLQISDEMRKALIAAALTDTIDGPRGRALAVIRTGIDRYAKYIGGQRHVIVVNMRPVMVCQAVDLANDLLKRVGLAKYRIDYPGAKFQSAFINGRNDNHPLADRFADMRGSF